MFPILTLWIHLVAVIFWLGGLLFQWLVLGPVLLGTHPTTRDLEVQRKVNLRFKTVRWISLITLIVTGLMNLLYEGGSARLESDWGGILMIKLFLVAVVIGLSVVLDVVMSPGGRRLPSSNLPASVGWINSGILLLGLLTSLIAVYLARF